MAGTGVGKYSTTASNNETVQSTNFAEGMAPSDVNNAARETMANMRSMYNQIGEGFVEYGDSDGEYTVARTDADTITITSSANLTSIYYAGRPIRILDGGGNTVTGSISSSSYSSPTLTVNLSGISLASGNPTKVELGPAMKAGGGRVILDDDEDSFISASTDDQVDITVGGTAQVEVKDGSIGPTTDSDVDLGTTAKRFKDAYVDTLTTTGNITVGGTLSGTLAASVLGAVYPVGSVYINATSSTNPATLLGFGTWAAFGAGRVPVGIDSSDTDFDTAEETGGAKTHTLAEANLPAHKHFLFANHSMNGTAAAHFVRKSGSAVNSDGINKSASLEYYQSSGSDDFKYSMAYDTNNAAPTVHPSSATGSGTATDHMNPYIVVYMWKRTA